MKKFLVTINFISYGVRPIQKLFFSICANGPAIKGVSVAERLKAGR